MTTYLDRQQLHMPRLRSHMGKRGHELDKIGAYSNTQNDFGGEDRRVARDRHIGAGGYEIPSDKLRVIGSRWLFQGKLKERASQQSWGMSTT